MSVRKVFLRRKRGSALILAIIIVMIMTILCSSIMVFTLANFRLSANYRKVVGGYYDSEKQLETGLKELQDKLKDFDLEARNYIKNNNFKAGLYTPIISISDNDHALSHFFTDTNDTWVLLKNSAATNDHFLNDVNSFLTKTYMRYYFLLIGEGIGKGELGFPSNPAVTSTDYKEYFTKVILNSPGSSISLKYGSSPENDDGVIGDYGTSTFDGKNVYIKVTYKKNDTSASKKVEQATIHTDLELMVPDVKFIASNSAVNTFDINDVKLCLGNAITAYGNIIVKDGSTANIDGDIYAGGNYDKANNKVGEVSSGDPSGYADSSVNAYKDMSVDDINAGGVRVGITGGTGEAHLNINGSIYTNGYVHTLSQKSTISVNTGYNGNVMDKSGYSDGSPTFYCVKDLIPNFIDPITESLLPGTKFDKYSSNGGDIFCQNLSTEETADQSSITVGGKVISKGNIQADGERSNISVDGDFFGISSGSAPDHPNLHSCILQNANIAQITLNKKIFVPATAFAMISKLHSGSTNYQTAESVSFAGSDTIGAYQNESDYLNYLKKGIDTDSSNNSVNITYEIPAAEPTGMVINNVEKSPGVLKYEPFDLYEFRNTSKDYEERTKHFISYFTKKDETGSYVNFNNLTNKVSGISVNNKYDSDPTKCGGGYILGTALGWKPSSVASEVNDRTKGGTKIISPWTSDIYPINKGTALDVSGNMTITISKVGGKITVSSGTFSNNNIPTDVTKVGIMLNNISASPATVTFDNKTGNPNLSVFAYVKNDSANKISLGQTSGSFSNAPAKSNDVAINDTWYDPSEVEGLINQSAGSAFWGYYNGDIKTAFEKDVSDYYENSNRPNFNNGAVTNMTDVLVYPKSKYPGDTVIINNDGTVTGTSFNGSTGGIMVTDKDVIIDGVTSFKGSIITTGNVIFQGGTSNISYDRESVYYKLRTPSTEVRGPIKKSVKLAKTLQLSINSTIGSIDPTKLSIDGVYRSDNMSRFKRKEWKQE